MDQQPWEGRSSADDFRTGTLSAMCGGTTTVIPFAMQMRGQSLKDDSVDDYHERARPKAHIDYSFHLVVGDPTPEVWRRSYRGSCAEGCTSLKIYLTYEGLKLDDYEVLQVLDVARREGAMVMVHAENDGCIRWLTERLLAERKTRIKYHVASHPTSVTARPRTARSACRNSPKRPCSSPMLPRVRLWMRSAGRRRGVSDLCGNLPAISVPVVR